MPSVSTVVLIDADNTLWDTDAVYRSAQLSVLSLTEAKLNRPCPADDRLSFVRTYDQALASAHHLHLRYPPQLLVRALEAGLFGAPPAAAARNAIAGRPSVPQPMEPSAVEAIVSEFVSALGQTPTLLPNVTDAVNAGKRAGFVLYVMTEGRIDRQRRLMEVHGLQSAFEGVWELTKNEAQFARLLARFPECRVVVVGDQPDRDIVPAKAAGCTTVFVPGPFTPDWNAGAPPAAADFLATDLLQAMIWCITSSANLAVMPR